MSNYPPGVSGNEEHITGPQREIECDGYCPVCKTEKAELVVLFWRHSIEVVHLPPFGHDFEEHSASFDYPEFPCPLCQGKTFHKHGCSLDQNFLEEDPFDDPHESAEEEADYRRATER